jgi:hypothetical protein
MTQEENRGEAAVSEVIGFIYIFGIVILSMSLIYILGYPALQSSMDASIFESSEQSFIVLQSDMKMVAFDQVPVKNLKIQLQGATLSVTHNSNITIEYSNGASNETLINASGEIEFQKNDRALTYENGGVWKRYPDGRIMVSSPRMYASANEPNITTVGVVSIKGTSSTGGRGIAVLNMRYNASAIELPPSPVNLTLRINSTYAPEWISYLESIGFTITNSTDTSLIALRNNTMVIVGIHLIDVDIY